MQYKYCQLTIKKIATRYFRSLIVALLLAASYVSVHAHNHVDHYPAKPLTFVVGFGEGGSADRMARTMAGYMSEALGQPVRVINKKGAGTQIAANYVLKKPADGYTIFASTFAPYLANTILKGHAKYRINDFAYLNAQWIDFDLIASRKHSSFKTLPQLLQAIKQRKRTISAAVVEGSSGEIMMETLLRRLDVPADAIEINRYDTGSKARASVVNGGTDFMIISAEGSESVRASIQPLAVVRNTKSARWDVPAINEALKPLEISVPVLAGSVRGFAVPYALREAYPHRYDILVDALQKTLARPDVIQALSQSHIGARWLGPNKTTALILEHYSVLSAHESHQSANFNY